MNFDINNVIWGHNEIFSVLLIVATSCGKIYKVKDVYARLY